MVRKKALEVGVVWEGSIGTQLVAGWEGSIVVRQGVE